mgnify:CR=1 FL=1
MNKSIIIKLHESVSKKTILFALLLVTVLLSLLLTKIDQAITRSGGMDVIYLQIAFSPKDFQIVLDTWGTKGIKKYLDNLWLDYFVTFISALFMMSAIAYFQRRRKLFSAENIGWYNIIFFLLPFFSIFFDYLENVLHHIIITDKKLNLVLIASISSSIKFLIIGSSLIYLLLSYFAVRKETREKKMEIP